MRRNPSAWEWATLGRTKLQCVGIQQTRGAPENVYVRPKPPRACAWVMSSQNRGHYFPPTWVSIHWWSVGVGMDWQSFHTPLPAITASTTSSQFLMKVVGIKQRKKTHGYFPFLAKIWQIPPHPYPWENHAPFDLVSTTVAGCVH